MRSPRCPLHLFKQTNKCVSKNIGGAIIFAERPKTKKSKLARGALRVLESSRAWAGMGSVQAFVSSPSFRRASSETWTSSPPVTGDGLLRILRGPNWRRHAEKQLWSEVAVFCARAFVFLGCLAKPAQHGQPDVASNIFGPNFRLHLKRG